MNARDMSPAAFVWWMVLLPALAGVGLYTLVTALPSPWELVAVVVLCLAGIVWAVREIRWSKRMQRKLEADVVELERIGRDD